MSFWTFFAYYSICQLLWFAGLFFFQLIVELLKHPK